MYLTYEEYKAYGGNIDNETTFDQYEFKSRKVIDSCTFNRVANNVAVISETIKRCMFELIRIEQLYDENITDLTEKDNNGSGKLVASFSNDGYTETYATGSSNVGDYILSVRKNSDDAEEKIVHDYLSGEYDDTHTPLLYRGVY